MILDILVMSTIIVLCHFWIKKEIKKEVKEELKEELNKKGDK